MKAPSIPAHLVTVVQHAIEIRKARAEAHRFYQEQFRKEYEVPTFHLLWFAVLLAAVLSAMYGMQSARGTVTYLALPHLNVTASVVWFLVSAVVFVGTFLSYMITTEKRTGNCKEKFAELHPDLHALIHEFPEA